MKRIVMALCALSLALGAKAQNTTSTATTNTSTVSEYTEATDYTATYNSDAKVGGFSVGGDISKAGYMKFGLSMGFGDYSSSTCYLGFGLQKRILFANSFLLQGMIYPYAGFKYYEKISRNEEGKEEKKDKYEFTYGASANLSLGFKLFTTKKSNSVYLTLGYYISAPEFETKNMFDNGDWGVGITIIK